MRARPHLDSDSSKKEEAAEGAMHEAREGKEEETREGAADGPTSGRRKRGAKPPFDGPNRKRRVKGSDKTGPAMKDAEGGSCGCGKAGTCDGNCSGKAGAKRGDALTAPEYLAACDLGIQDRSRTYIRARLDAAAQRQDVIRTDSPKGKPCGASHISKGQKCSKGAGTPAQGAGGARPLSQNYKQELNTVNQQLQNAGFAGYLKNNKIARPRTQAGFDKVSKQYSQSEEAQQYNQLYEKRRKLKRQRGQRNSTLALAAGLAVGAAVLSGRGRMRPRGDSPYAPGFTPDMAELAI
jgi:hypothetical protein